MDGNQVSYLRVGASDLLQSLTFYEDIMGLTLTNKNIDDGSLLFSLSGITLIFDKSDEDADICPCRYLGIPLKIQHIFQVYEYFLSQGVKFDPPRKTILGWLPF